MGKNNIIHPIVMMVLQSIVGQILIFTEVLGSTDAKVDHMSDQRYFSVHSIKQFISYSNYLSNVKLQMIYYLNIATKDVNGLELQNMRSKIYLR